MGSFNMCSIVCSVSKVLFSLPTETFQGGKTMEMNLIGVCCFKGLAPFMAHMWFDKMIK